MDALLALQCFVVLFLFLHDWVPLGSLNDLKGVSTADSFGKRVAGTFISAVPFAVGLMGTILHFEKPLPDWLFWWLWISYVLLFYGILQAWWIPYFLHPDPEKAARYEIMFGKTHPALAKNQTGRCLAGSIAAVADWCFRWCRAARDSADRRSKPAHR
jgi:hypothetical protein